MAFWMLVAKLGIILMASALLGNFVTNIVASSITFKLQKHHNATRESYAPVRKANQIGKLCLGLWFVAIVILTLVAIITFIITKS